MLSRSCVAWQGGIDVTIAALHYRITMPPVMAQGVGPATPPWWEIPAWTAGGVTAGLILGLLVAFLGK